MHELPENLNKTLRSWRGSIHRDAHDDNTQQFNNLEKGPDDYGEKYRDESSEHINATQTSLMPVRKNSKISLEYSLTGHGMQHPTRSSQGLHQAWLQQSGQRSLNQQKDDGYGPSSPRQEPQLASPIQGRDHAQDSIVTLPRRQATFASQQPPPSAKRSIYSQPKIADPDPAADRLDDNLTPLTPGEFYELMGMRPPSERTGQAPRNLSMPNGLYTRIHGSFRYVQWQYQIFDVATYVLLAVQILLSAVFIVLGSLSRVDSHIAIAVLGAVSTVIAGILALMKGQGLPNRLRQTRDGLRNVLFEAEELYWDFGAGRPVLYKDVKTVREDYLRVMEQARKNHPDTWNETAGKIAQGISQTSSSVMKTKGNFRHPTQVSLLHGK